MLQVKSQFVAEYIEQNYLPLLSAAIIRVFGQGTKLEYRVLIDSTSGAGTMLPSAGTPAGVQPMPIGNAAQNAAFDSQLNNLYTFDSFIAGDWPERRVWRLPSSLAIRLSIPFSSMAEAE